MHSRLLLKNIEACASELPSLQGFDQGPLIDDTSAGSEDHKSRCVHHGELTPADGVAIFWSQWNVQAQKIGLAYKGFVDYPLRGQRLFDIFGNAVTRVIK